MARPASLAEHYRAHRQVFLLAQELGCTPKEAEHEMARRAARDRWEETRQRLIAKRDGRPSAAAIRTPDETTERREPWMMRD